MINKLKMQNRFLILIIILITAAGFVLTGCGKKESPKDATPAAEKKEGRKGKEDPVVVTLSEEKQKAAGIETIKISSESISVSTSATAVIELNADKVSKISPRTSGRIVKLIASLGDRVKAGQPLALFDSPELGQTWAEYAKAKGRVELTQKNLKREESLFEKKISPEKDVLKVRQELSEAEADLNFSKERFRLLGIDISRMELQRNGNANDPLLIPISSAISGVVIEKTVSQGEVVNTEKALFTVADLSTLWVVIDIYEKDIPRLKTGAEVKVAVTAFPGRDFRGKIAYVNDVMDEKTRTVKARVTVSNTSGLLKPGMFATVAIAGDKSEKVLAVPASAIQQEGEYLIVFVAKNDSIFEKRIVTVGPAMDGLHHVLSGIKEGEVIVIKGAFILKSEAMKSLMED
ncbi:MAG: efflux RND transporter periplasmic adaptor subunit [Thermodesulfovibrionales bacterium]